MRYYYLKDHLGSIRMTVDANGNPVGWDDYYPYGMQMTGRSYTSSADQRYKFTGKELDAPDGLYYFGRRYYDSFRGQWLQVDPLADKYPGWSSYNYVMDNPERNVDPNGAFVDDYYFDSNGNLVNHVKTKDPDRVFLETGKDNKGLPVYNQIDMNFLKEFYSIVAGESTNNVKESKGIANVLLNRMKYTGTEMKGGFSRNIDSGTDFDSKEVKGGIYSTLMSLTFSAAFNSPYNSRILSALSTLSANSIDNSNGAYFWNASDPQTGWNWNEYKKGVYSITASYGQTTFFKYNSDPLSNPKFYTNIWP